MASSSPKLQVLWREHSNCTSGAQRAVDSKLRPPRNSAFGLFVRRMGSIKALEGWNVQATLAILGTCGDQRAIGPIRRLLDRAEPVHTEAKAVLKQLGASWYDQRSD